MIYEKDLDEAIAVCQGEKSPNANTCYKLAAYMILKRELFGKSEPVEERAENAYSFAAGPAEPVDTRIDYKSDTDFSQVIDGKDAAEIWPIMDELMSTIEIMYPRLYDAVMRKLQE